MVRPLLLVATIVLAACGNGGGAPDAVSPYAAVACAADAAAPCITVNDAGVSFGCGQGGIGPGDRDDGGGAPPPPPPDASATATNQPFGAQCLSNAQCSSNLCFYYRVKGQFCTRTCRCNADCPPPSLGCGGMGVCRVGN